MSGQLSLLFQIDYPEIEDVTQPRHRFMSAYEQKVEAPDKNYQYILFAAEPYGMYFGFTICYIRGFTHCSIFCMCLIYEYFSLCHMK